MAYPFSTLEKFPNKAIMNVCPYLVLLRSLLGAWTGDIMHPNKEPVGATGAKIDGLSMSSSRG